MRNLLFLGIILLLTGCDKEKNSKLDPSAMISIRAAQSNRASGEGHLSALEIVQKTSLMQWRTKELGGLKPERGFADSQRDFANERLLMWGTDIINVAGRYVPDFIEGFDMVLVMAKAEDDARGDTIAYIPNGVLRAAKEIIKPAFDREDYATCYKVFDEAFTFIPITGAEWRALKDAGNN